MEFSLGRSTPTPTPQAEPQPERERPHPRTPSHSMDLSFAPKFGGGDVMQLHDKGDNDDVGADWLNLVSAWWDRHGYYPDQAAQMQQEGDVTLRLKVARDGQVEELDVEQRSGSQWLDLGALSVFRNAHLPPLPPDVTSKDISLDFTIHYIILR